MKRFIIGMIIIVLVVISIVYYKYKLYISEINQSNYFNKIYLEYDKSNLYGTEVTTVINKAMDNNQKYKIEKDELNQFINDDEYSIKIFITFDDENVDFPMEKLYTVGIEQFTSYFGELKFKCTKVNYHANGRISEMFFQAINY